MKQIYTHKTNPILKQTSTRNINPKPFSMLVQPQTKLDFLNIFIIQNKGKGPPGRTRSPGMAFCPARDNQPLAFNPHHPERCPGGCPEFIDGFIEGSLPEPVEGKNQIEYELQTHIKPNFLSQLNFTIMKKQILFLAFFVLAVMAGITDTYGQGAAPSTQLPRTLTGCNDYPLHPLPGKEYAYQVTNPTADATSYTWWATKNPNFIDLTNGGPDLTNMLTPTAGELISVSGDYNSATGGSTVSITWSPQILANTLYLGTPGTDPSPTFVAVMANGSCTNNIQVYELNPLKAFTVDVANFDATKAASELYGETVSTCVDEVRGAAYSGGSLTMDYGTNTITFEVIAANFVDTWTPLLQVNGLLKDQTATIGWAYTIGDAVAGNYVQSISGLTEGGTLSGTTAATTTSTNTVNGVSIYVTVVVDNNTYETLLAQNVTLTVDGVDSTGQWDLTTNCLSGTAPDQDDTAVQVLTPRPEIIHNTVDGAPVPDDFIPKP